MESAASADAMMRQELESVDFYITQGYSDIAFDTLELLERQFGPHPEIDARRKKLEAAQQSAERSGPRVLSAELVMPHADPVTETDAAVDIAFGDIEIGEPRKILCPAASCCPRRRSGERH